MLGTAGDGAGEACLATTGVSTAADKRGCQAPQGVVEMVEIVRVDEDAQQLEEEEEEGPELSDSARNRLLPSATPATNSGHAHKELRTESIWLTFVQVFFPFLIAGFGTVGAGRLLDEVQVCGGLVPKVAYHIIPFTSCPCVEVECVRRIQ